MESTISKSNAGSDPHKAFNAEIVENIRGDREEG
jgi:hypothetical protein